MKTKIKRRSRSVLSVILAICILISCIMAGIIATDAAKDDSEPVGYDDVTISINYGTGGTARWIDQNVSIDNNSGTATFDFSSLTVGNEYDFFIHANEDYYGNTGITVRQDGSEKNFGVQAESGANSKVKVQKAVSGVTAHVKFSGNQVYVSFTSPSGGGGETTTDTWSLVGNNTDLFSSGWDPSTAEDMTTNDNGATYTWSKNNVHFDANTKIEYKAVKNHAWDGCVPSGDNATYTIQNAGDYNVSVTFTKSTSKLTMTATQVTRSTLSVASNIANAKVTATYGTTTIDEGGNIPNVPAGETITININPDSGYIVDTVTATNATVTPSGNFWTMTMPSEPSEISATMHQIQTKRIYFNNINTGYSMISAYAYTEVGGVRTEYLGKWSGTTMTKMPNSNIWYIDGVPEGASIIFIGDGHETGVQTVPANNSNDKFIPGSDREEPGTGSSWGQYVVRNNEYTVTDGPTMNDKTKNLYTGISATLYDYYVDNEYTGGWLTGITAESDWKCTTNENDPYTKLNSALADYKDAYSVTHPLYFGNLKTANYSGFELKPNNSTGLNNPNNAVTGLSGTSIYDSSIHYYKSGATNENGANMAMFDEDFLSGENKWNRDLAAILRTSSFPVRTINDAGKGKSVTKIYMKPYSSDTYKIYDAYFFDGDTGFKGWVAMEASGNYYVANIPSQAKKVIFVNRDNSTHSTGWDHMHTQSVDITLVTSGNDLKNVYEYSSTNGEGKTTFTASLDTTKDGYVNSPDGHVYYEYNSTGGKDNAYITDITKGSTASERTAKINYYGPNDANMSRTSQENKKGFFPFDYNNIIAETTYPTDTLYIDRTDYHPNGENEYWYARFWVDGSNPLDEAWVRIDGTGDNVTVVNPDTSKYNRVIFMRKSKNESGWSDIINQTPDLTLPTGKDKNVKYTFSYWPSSGNKFGGSWGEKSDLQPNPKTNGFAEPNGTLPHDLGFGMKLEIPFTLEDYGKFSDGTHQIFEFSGDDDLWVFVDDQLILDLGGAHGATAGSIDFADKTVTALMTQKMDDADRNYINSTFTIDNRNPNKPHKMVIYYMERGMFDSNLKFGFSFQAIANQFQAEKKVRTNSSEEEKKINSGFFVVNPTTQSDILVDNKPCTWFQKSFQDEKFDIEHAYTDLKTGVTNPTYTIGDTNYTATPSNNKITYTLENTNKTEKIAYFIDQFQSGDNYTNTFTLKETPKNTNKYNYEPSLTVYDDANNKKEFEPTSGALSKGKITGDNTNGYQFQFKPTTDATGLEVLNIRARFVNQMKCHELDVSKEINGTDTTTDFTVQILFKCGTNDYIAYPLDCIIDGERTKLGTDGKISIKAGQTVKMLGIPENAKVKIVEDLNDETSPYGYTQTALTGASATATGDKNVEFTMGNSNVSAVVKNLKASLLVSHNLKSGSVGTANCFTTVNVKDGNNNVATYNKTDDNINVEPKYLKSNSTKDLEIVLETDPADNFKLSDFYEQITGTLTKLAATGTPYSAVINIPNKTATVTVHIRDLFGSGKQTYNLLPFFSELGNQERDLVISKKILDSMTSSETYTVYVKTKESASAQASTAYTGAYSKYDASTGTTTQYATSTGEFTLDQNDSITIKSIGNLVYEVTEKAFDSTYQRKFHYQNTYVNGTEVTASNQTEGLYPVTNGVVLTTSESENTTVDINNKAWGYRITYSYPGYLNRYNANASNQTYAKTGLFSEADYNSIVQLATVKNSSDRDNDCYGVAFQSDDARKNFVTSKAPYQDNFMTKLTWNPDFNAGGNSSSKFYLNNQGEEVTMTTSAVIPATEKSVYVYFQLPYDHTDSNNGIEPIPSSVDDNRILEKEDSTLSVTTTYGKWYTLNNIYSPDNANFVSAPNVIYKKNSDGTYTKKVFGYWLMSTAGGTDSILSRNHSKKQTVEYKRCYNRDFNMTFYQDSYVKAVYVDADSQYAALTPAERESYDNIGGARINFLENSRNQWNNNGGVNQKPARTEKGDRIYSDFLVTLDNAGVDVRSQLGKYKDVPLLDDQNQPVLDKSGNQVMTKEFVPYLYKGQPIRYSADFILEQVNELNKVEGVYQTKSQNEYREMYSSGYNTSTEAATQTARVAEYVNGNYNNANVTTTDTNADGATFLLHESLNCSSFDNKNELEYSTSIPNSSHSTGLPTTYKNYVYRAYVVLKDVNVTGNKSDYTWDGKAITDDMWTAISGHTGTIISVSKPTYFTIYDIASIQDGETYTGEGES